MNKYEEIRTVIDGYLMERFKYRLSLVYLTPDNIIVTRRNSRIDLYLRLRQKESLFPPNCLIIARLGFKKERIGHGTHFIRFLLGIAKKCDFKYIGIESVNDKSRAFAEKLGFHSIDSSNYVVSVEDLIAYFGGQGLRR
ncbi:MAG: GNAT family N-acetyltransferase [Bacteroidales bacterium]|nr:GNAT family N-acetyltransferase [Bacteroidales bacterium]